MSHRRLRIAQLAPLAEAVPPKLYGGTERVVSWLTEALVRRGHEVTLFASGDSRTDAELVPCCETALRLLGDAADPAAHASVQLRAVLEQADRFDVIHSHLDHLFFPLARMLQVPTVTTLHNRIDSPQLRFVYERFSDVPFVSISHAQRAAVPRANWVANVYHGLPLDLLRYQPSCDDYVAFIGRFSPEKRVDSAIRVAIAAGTRLKIAAKIDEARPDYFHREIEPLLAHPLVEYVGEIDDAQKGEFLGRARALLFMIDWPEPFGLAMIEAMACGTPVIARCRGAVPEVIDDGVTGFCVEDEAQAIEALRRIDALERRQVRDQFERRFSVERMVDDYEALYHSLLGARHDRAPLIAAL